MVASQWRMQKACLTLWESSTSRHFKKADGDIKINVTFLPAASFSCLIADSQRGLGGLRRFWCSFMKRFCIQTEIIKDFGWNAVQRRKEERKSPLPLTLQSLTVSQVYHLVCSQRGSWDNASSGYRKSRCESCLLRCCFLKSPYPGHREKIPDEINRLYIALSLSLCSVHALDPASLSLPEHPASSFTVVHQKHKQYSLHTLGKINSQHTGAKTHPKTSTDKYSRVRTMQLSKTL